MKRYRRRLSREYTKGSVRTNAVTDSPQDLAESSTGVAICLLGNS
jgi:hypothetical protein